MRTLIITALFISPLAMANCKNAVVLPTPAIPDGSTSSIAEFSAAQAAVKEYVAAGERYLDCYRPYDGYHNHVVEQMQDVSEQYNRALQEFQQSRSALAGNNVE